MRPEFPEYFDRKANQIVTDIKDLLREAYYEGYRLGKDDMISIAEAILKGREENGQRNGITGMEADAK